MLAGRLYRADDAELVQARNNARRLTDLYNQSHGEDAGYRSRLLKELFGAVGSNCFIEAPFRCDYGFNIHIGENFFANYDCIILDVCKITVGESVFFGPRVCVYTAQHPMDARVRKSGLESGKPVTIGNDVWIGGNTVINPGVSVGNNVVIGSGSVVTKDIPDNVVAAGAPCRVLRSISMNDKVFWQDLQSEYETWAGAHSPE